ncbi:MAG: tail fiber domain-containing protein [Ilumatobacteraceae bacterium]
MVTPTPTTVQVKMQLRGDTAANWASVNPVLLAREVGLETDTKKVKVGDGTTAWNSLAYFPSIVSGGTVLGNLEIGTTGTLTFEGSTADGFETTLAVTDPTADRTITLPDQSGTVVVTGNASIVDADIAANAEIAVSKLANGTANQVIVTDGTNVSWSDDLTLAGNLTVNGTTTTVNTETLVVKDKNIEMGVVGTPTDLTADGGGITLKGTTDKTINWIDATDAWTSSERFSVPLGSAASPSLTFTGDENSGVYSPGADQLAISTNGAGALFIDASGRVGVGTSSPTGNLSFGASDALISSDTVDGSDNKSVTIAGGGAATTSRGAFLALYGNEHTTGIGGASLVTGLAAGSDLLLQARTSTSSVLFNVNNSERARIDSSGRLGLGTSTPQTLCHFASLSDPTLRIENTSDALVNGADIGSIEWYINDASSGGTGVGGEIALVGDGTMTGGGVATRMELRTYNASSLNTGLTINKDGKVGIGTTSPSAALHIEDTTASVYTRIISSDTGVAGILFGDTGYPSRGRIYYDNSDDSLGFWGASGTVSTERVRIDSSGRLLVGTSSVTNLFSAASPRLPANEMVNGAGVNDRQTLLLRTNSTTASGPQLCFLKNKAADSTCALVAADDELGFLNFYGADGTDFATTGAAIGAYVDGTPGANDMPGRIVLSTTADGTSSPTERMRIGSDGKIYFGNFDVVASAGYIEKATTGDYELDIVASRSESTGRDMRFFSRSNAESMRIDSSGRLLVGTSSAPTNVYPTTVATTPANVFDSDTAQVSLMLNNNSPSGNIVSFARRYAAAADGTISRLIFSQYDGSNYRSAAQIAAEIDGTPGVGDMPGRLVFSTTADGASSPTERMRIGHDGAFNCYTSSNEGFSVRTSAGAGTGAYIYQGFRSASSTTTGTVVYRVYSNGTYATISDATQKKNISTARDGYLEDLNALRVVKYHWNEQDDSEQKELGLIAQEVETVFPGLIAEFDSDAGETIKGIKNSVLTFMLIKALQEATGRIETLEAEVAALKAQ